LKEFYQAQNKKELEAQAMNLLNSGQANVSAMVDQLLGRALMTSGLPVSAQIFKDYHGELLEKLTSKSSYREDRSANKKKAEVEVEAEAKAPAALELPETETLVDGKTSLKEVLVSLQNINPKDLIQISEVRDVNLAVSFEGFEQMMNAAVNKLASKRMNNKKILISNQVHSDRSVINLYLSDNTFTATELDFSQNHQSISMDSMDMNMIILREMASETQTAWHMENKTDKNGNITGMNIRFTVNRVSKEKSNKNLVSVVKGKKKDIAREFLN